MSSSTSPLVTIAIPTYNRADGYLRVALESALAQTYAPLEIIVADNGSTDRTEAVVAEYADPRVRYFRHAPALKPNDNFNFCVTQARGAYLLLLHDDDAIDADFIQSCVAAMGERTDVGIIRTGTRLMDARGQVYGEAPNRAGGLSTRDFFLAWFEQTTALYLCSTLYHTAHLRATGGFRSRHNLFQDGMATVVLAARFGRIDIADVKASFRVHGGALTGAAKVRDWSEDSLDLLETMCALVDAADVRTLRAHGTRFFAQVNYSRAATVRTRRGRIAAFVFVFRFFGYRHLPGWRLALGGTAIYDRLRRWKRRLLGRSEWVATAASGDGGRR